MVRGLFLTWNVNGSSPEDEKVQTEIKKVLTRSMDLNKNEEIGLVALGIQESGKMGWAHILLDFFGQKGGRVLECKSGSQARVGLAVMILPEFYDKIEFLGKSKVLFHNKGTLTDLVVRTKATLFVEVSIEKTPLVIMCSHLPAYAPGFAYLVPSKDGDGTLLRDDALKEAETMVVLEDNRLVYQAQNVVWMGDFNYRCNEPLTEEEVQGMRQGKVSVESIRDRKKDTLLTGMKCLQDSKRCILTGFREIPVTFPPTYRLEILGKKRKQKKWAWTDRIVYKTKDSFIRPETYDAVLAQPNHWEGVISDHCAVLHTFMLGVKKINQSATAAMCVQCGKMKKTILGLVQQ